MNDNECYIILENDKHKIKLNKQKNYTLKEFKAIFNNCENLNYIDYDGDEIEITEEEEINYFLINLVSCEDKIIINNFTYQITKSFTMKTIDQELSELQKENFITEILQKDDIFLKKKIESNSDIIKLERKKGQLINSDIRSNNLEKIFNCFKCSLSIKKYIWISNKKICNSCFHKEYFESWDVIQDEDFKQNYIS